MQRPALIISFRAVAFVLIATVSTAAAAEFQAGFAKIDVTPAVPLRLSGYGDRDKPFESIDEKLFVRAVAMKHGDNSVHVVVSAETLGFAGEHTTEIYKCVHDKFGIERARLVLCATHTHTAPFLIGNAPNIFAAPLSDAEENGAESYVEQMIEAVVQAIGEAIEDLRPVTISFGEGKATFAANRRVIENGKCVAMAPFSNGPVDHSLPFLHIVDAKSGATRGILFNYACHCTTFGGEYNRTSGDWAGYASQFLETAYPDAIAVCTIGCGADANPQRPGATAREVAIAQGREIANEIERLAAGELKPITAAPRATFGYAGLPVDRPTQGELKERLKDGSPQVRKHANNMLKTLSRHGRLPESYPMPIHVWRFADELAMVFLGGEVCVDYAIRIKKELDSQNVWVTAYADDVFGYVASERMRDEGGYEVDFSMIFYNIPGRWSTGTENVVLRRVHELYDNSLGSEPLSVDDALRSFTVPEGFAVDVVAAEPLIADPVSFSVGADGRLWVVEMGDYPRGANGDGEPGGCVKVLTDVDGDGRYDEAAVFLDRLRFPTSVIPWRDGAIVSCAPDIFFARDTDGDHRADEREVLFTDFHDANPQHRVNTFAYGLDHWLQLAAGEGSDEVLCVKSGEKVNIGGRDLRIRPDDGTLEPVSGPSQYGRCRDDWGNWFGNMNVQPLFHYVIEDRYLRRNPFVASRQSHVYMTEPSLAPPVYPTSRTLDRFNDLYDVNRFTSASSPTIFRDASLGDDTNGAAFVCEPVHNLVSRILIDSSGVAFSGKRHPNEQASEFFSSSDNWCRPSWLATGPDGALWIADMYRHVIEHPEWIPEAWQKRLDLYAGKDKGRIYRIYRKDAPLTSPPNLAKQSTIELIQQFEHANGWRRDVAQQLIIARLLQSKNHDALDALTAMAQSNENPLARLHALETLSVVDELTDDLLREALRDPDARIVRRVIVHCEPRLSKSADFVDALLPLVDADDIHVQYQLALSLGESDDPRIGEALLRLATRDPDNEWMRAAVLSSARPHASAMLAALLTDIGSIGDRRELLNDLIATSLGDNVASNVAGVVSRISASSDDAAAHDWRIEAMASCAEAVNRRGAAWATVIESDPSVAAASEPIFTAARQLAMDASAPAAKRIAAFRLLGYQPKQMENDAEFLFACLSPRESPEIQIAAIRTLADRDVPELASRLLADWKQLGPTLRPVVSATLLTRNEWLETFIGALRSGDVPATDIDVATRSQLLQHRSFYIRNASHQIFDDIKGENRDDIVAAYAGAAELQGDITRGATQFQRICSSCHRHHDVGTDLAPKLSALQDLSSQFLITAILDPNRAIDDKFQTYVVVTESGKAFSGLIKSETANSIELAEHDGTIRSILRIDIDEIVNTGKSFMPEGLEKELSQQDIADVMEFVRSKPTSGAGDMAE